MEGLLGQAPPPPSSSSSSVPSFPLCVCSAGAYTMPAGLWLGAGSWAHARLSGGQTDTRTADACARDIRGGGK